jgi:hypothetical protein
MKLRAKQAVYFFFRSTLQDARRRIMHSSLKTKLVLLTILTAFAQLANAQDRPDVKIDARMKEQAVMNLSSAIETTYPFAEMGRTAASELRNRLKAGRYEAMDGAKAFAAALTGDVRSVTKDQHFRVEYFVVPRPFPVATPASAKPAEMEERKLASALQNYGFAAVDRLRGNVGLLRLTRFESPTLAAEQAVAAMQFLSNTDALIIDLRENGGGHAQMAALLASYFFEEQVHLSDVIGKEASELKQNWTPAYTPGRKYLGKPIYILTSSRTFSAAEGFAYDLQALKRATIVGERTRGGANPVSMIQLSERFAALVPSARARNPITGGNWDGVGVTPDVVLSADAALTAAHLSALEAVAPKHKDDPLTRELEETIDALRADVIQQKK